MRPSEAPRPTPRPTRRLILGGGLAAAAATAAVVARPERLAQKEPAPRAGATMDGKPAHPPPRPPHRTRPFLAGFSRRGLVTNAYAFRHPGAADATTHRDWTVTSGSLFARWGSGWSGVPDGLSPDPASRLRTGSAVLRVVSARHDFHDVTVGARFRLHPPVTTGRTPAVDWDGGHLWLRYQGPQELYALSFCRRDGAVTLKRKAPPPGAAQGAEGVYTTLAQAMRPLRYETWHHIVARATTTASDTVQLRLRVDGREVLRAEDTAPGRLAGAGAVGIRGDNTELLFHGFTALGAVRPLGRRGGGASPAGPGQRDVRGLRTGRGVSAR
ncbi:hypothetical protein [Streptomyces sp. NPDC017520]|uniref:hypothetical protein n=1 Tax=Streptomyces sp. NPDC017520 TaxID=3364998 RepID=UPI00379FC1B7